MKKVAAVGFLALSLWSCQSEKEELKIERTIHLAENAWQLNEVTVKADISLLAEGESDTLLLDETIRLLADDCYNDVAMKLFADGRGELKFGDSFCGSFNQENNKLAWTANEDYTEITFTGSNLMLVVAEGLDALEMLPIVKYQLKEVTADKLVLMQQIDFNEDFSDYLAPEAFGEDMGEVEISGFFNIELRYQHMD